MSTTREHQRATPGSLWTDPSAPEPAPSPESYMPDSTEPVLRGPARGMGGLRYRFPRTPPRIRLGDVQVRMDETLEGAARFRSLAEKLERAVQRRVPEAVLTRALRRFLVAHQGAFLQAARQCNVRGRAIVEEDVEEMLARALEIEAEATQPQPRELTLESEGAPIT